MTHKCQILNKTQSYYHKRIDGSETCPDTDDSTRDFIADVSNTVCNVDSYLVVFCYCQDIRISGQCQAEREMPPLSIHCTDSAITRVIALRVISRKTFTSSLDLGCQQGYLQILKILLQVYKVHRLQSLGK